MNKLFRGILGGIALTSLLAGCSATAPESPLETEAVAPTPTQFAVAEATASELCLTEINESSSQTEFSERWGLDDPEVYEQAEQLVFAYPYIGGGDPGGILRCAVAADGAVTFPYPGKN